ncbi:hypothetical protein, partial [Leclercia adecarboxylata]|uniref:hypothetical protein n=1 Tax=Leclercia adecarboxylata TaxID=83655 RepID=UPI0029499429
ITIRSNPSNYSSCQNCKPDKNKFPAIMMRMKQISHDGFFITIKCDRSPFPQPSPFLKIKPPGNENPRTARLCETSPAATLFFITLQKALSRL